MSGRQVFVSSVESRNTATKGNRWLQTPKTWELVGGHAKRPIRHPRGVSRDTQAVCTYVCHLPYVLLAVVTAYGSLPKCCDRRACSVPFCSRPAEIAPCESLLVGRAIGEFPPHESSGRIFLQWNQGRFRNFAQEDTNILKNAT